MKRAIALVIATLIILTAALSASAAPTDSIGPVHVEPAVTLYLVSDGNPCEITVTWTEGGNWSRFAREQMLTRVIDPDEDMTYWKYDETRDKTQYPFTHRIALAPKAGVHQVRLIAGMKNSNAQVALSRPLPYGITGQCGVFNPWNPSLKEAWAWVPPNAKRIEVQGGPVAIHDASGKPLLATREKKQKAKADLPQTRTNLRFSFPSPSQFSFRAAGFPLILCDSPETATRIRASTIELPDGRIVYHKFQAQILEMLPEILKPENAGVPDELIKPLDANVDAWLQEPIRNNYLLGSWAPMEHVPWILRSQVTDPASPISGAVLDVASKPKKGAQPSGKGFGAVLAFAATLDKPFNPYHGKKQLLYRAAAIAMRDLMRLSEDETFANKPEGNINDYPTGILYFPLAQAHTNVFAIAAPLLPPKVRSLWARALRRPVDRMFPIALVTCRNQSSHGMVILAEYAEGSGDKTYERMGSLFADRFAREITSDSFDMERCGPDASYQGMTDWHKGYYYCMTRHKGIRESLRKTYTFFNHTVAPEPDGTVLGAVNFSHRTAASFAREQYNGARGMCADVMPEIGIWTPPPTQKDKEDAIAAIKRRFETPFTPEDYKTGSPRVAGRSGGLLSVPRYRWYTPKPAVGVFPAQEKAPFIRELGGELIAVRRPRYYAATYVGNPAGEYYIRTRHDHRKPRPDNAEDKDGKVSKYDITPYSGGGLSIFWTPEYGNALLGANWTPRTHHGLLVRMPDTTRWWEDYTEHSHQLDADTGTLTIRGKIEKQPIEYTRTMHFGDESLEMTVTLSATKDIETAGIVEIIPFVHGEKKANGVLLDVPSRGNAFTIHDRNGHGVRYTFESEHAFKSVRAMYHAKYEHRTGRIEVSLPNALRAGKPVTLKYEIRPVDGATGGTEK